MSLLSEIPNPYVAALFIGFTYGLFFCTSTCLPYVASYIAGINAGFRRGVAVTLIFNSGRITAYGLIGAAIGLFKLFMDDSFRLVFQTYSSFIFGVLTIAIGVTILVRDNQPSCNCAVEANKVSGSNRIRDRFDLRAYSLGLSRGLLLCAPLLVILGYSVTYASPVDSFALAVIFGIGTALSPIVLLGGATGWLLNKAPLFRKWISRLGAISLIVLGAITLFSAIVI